MQDGVGALYGPASTSIASAVGRMTRSTLRRRASSRTSFIAGCRATGTGADHQSAASPGDVLADRQRGVPVRAAEPFGRGFLALADISAVDDRVVMVGYVVDSYRTE